MPLPCARPLQEFESSLDAWMAEFHTYMTLDCPPALAESDPEKQSVVDAVKATVGGWVGGWGGPSERAERMLSVAPAAAWGSMHRPQLLLPHCPLPHHNLPTRLPHRPLAPPVPVCRCASA